MNKLNSIPPGRFFIYCCLIGVVLFFLYVWLHLYSLGVFTNSDPTDCPSIANLRIEIPKEELESEKSYPIQIIITTPTEDQEYYDTELNDNRQLSAFIYNKEQAKRTNSKYKNAFQSKTASKIIGELYYSDFTYSDYIDGNEPDLLIGDDFQIYQCGWYK